MEKECENYINKKLNLQIITAEELETYTVKLVNYITTVRQPYIENFWTSVKHIKICYSINSIQKNKYFKNLYFLTNKFIKQTLPLSAIEKQEMLNVLFCALKADVFYTNT